MEARAPLPTEHLANLKIGRELFRGRSDDDEWVTFVCYDDGFAIRRGGHAIPGFRWDMDGVDDALAAYRGLTALRVRRPVAPPAA